MPKLESHSSLFTRGYVYVYFPASFRRTLAHAAEELGFGSLPDLIRTAVREYLEKRGYLERRKEELEARQPTT